jgi:hypothetical protein
MCTNLELRDGGNGLTLDQKQNQKVIFEPIDQIKGKPLEGFEDLFFKHGGRAGGWRR